MSPMFDAEDGRQKHWTDGKDDESGWECACGFECESAVEAVAHDDLGYFEAPEAPALEELEVTMHAVIERARAEGHAEGLQHAARLAANAAIMTHERGKGATGEQRLQWGGAETALKSFSKLVMDLSEGGGK